MSSSVNSNNVTFTTSGTSGDASTDTFSVVYEGATLASGTGSSGLLGVGATDIELLTAGSQGSLLGLLGTDDFVDSPGVDATFSTGLLTAVETYNFYVGGTLDLTGSAIGLLSDTNIYVYGGTLTSDSAAVADLLSGTTITVEDGGVLNAVGNNLISALDGATISFGTNGGTITADATTDASVIDLLSNSTVDGFNSGSDVIDFQNTSAQTVTSYVISTSGGTSTITLYDGTTAIGEVQVESNSTLTSGTYTSGTSGPLTVTEDASGTGFQISATPSTFESVTLCYLRGTRVLTPTGEVAIEDIKPGDELVTRFGGIRKVQWIGHMTRCPFHVQNLQEVAPIRIRAGALGGNRPARDLYVSPGHSMLVDGQLLLAKLLVNGVTITQEIKPEKNPPLIEYFQVDFGTHDCIIAEGSWSESFADAPGLRDAFDNAAEFYSFFPSHRPPEELELCALRPERGRKLNAVLLPIMEQAAKKVTPGMLLGCFERVDGPWTIVGWAWDEANPDLPVLLEILLDGKPIGTVLACEYRSDVEQAGFGSGHSGFIWTAPVTLPPNAKSRLYIRRVADGAVVPGSARSAEPQPSVPKLRLVI